MDWLPIAQGFALVVAAVLLVAIIGAAYWLFSMPIQRSSGWEMAMEIIDNTKGKGMSKDFEIYVDGAYVGGTDKDTFSLIRGVIDPLVHSMDIEYGFGDVKARFSAGQYTPLVVRKVIAIMDGEKQPTLKDAAKAFEKAINSADGIDAEIRSVAMTSIGETYPRKIYSVIVSATKKERVYP